jgi:UDP-N-acetylglucosamine transferase subunit ALG13
VVFVTVGNAKQGFGRLLNAVGSLAARGRFRDEPVIVQYGHNLGFSAAGCECVPFLSMGDFQRLLEEADVVVSHGGSTVLAAVRLGKVPVVMPRRRAYHEHVNDHQVRFVEALAEEGCVVPVYEPSDLEGALARARQPREDRWQPERADMLSLVRQAIAELGAGSGPVR